VVNSAKKDPAKNGAGKNNARQEQKPADLPAGRKKGFPYYGTSALLYV
jgi:hypothetical protein